MKYFSVGIVYEPGIIPIILCPYVPLGVVKWVAYPSVSGSSPKFENFLAIMKAAAILSPVPVARPPQIESARNDTSLYRLWVETADNAEVCSRFQSPCAALCRQKRTENIMRSMLFADLSIFLSIFVGWHFWARKITKIA